MRDIRIRRTAIVRAADRVLRHEFDLLGSGLRRAWRQPAVAHRLQDGPRVAGRSTRRDIDYHELDRPTDVKVPWELSRCQHFTTLGQAYWLTGDERYAREFVDESQRLDRAEPVGPRRELGVRDGRRAAGGQLDLGLLFHCAARAACAIAAHFAARFSARCTCTASSSRATSSGRTSTATTICATASAWCFSARSSARHRSGRRWLQTRQGDRCRGDLQPDHAQTASTSRSRPRITGSSSKRF